MKKDPQFPRVEEVKKRGVRAGARATATGEGEEATRASPGSLPRFALAYPSVYLSVCLTSGRPVCLRPAHHQHPTNPPETAESDKRQHAPKRASLPVTFPLSSCGKPGQVTVAFSQVKGGKGCKLPRHTQRPGTNKVPSSPIITRPSLLAARL